MKKIFAGFAFWGTLTVLFCSCNAQQEAPLPPATQQPTAPQAIPPQPIAPAPAPAPIVAALPATPLVPVVAEPDTKSTGKIKKGIVGIDKPLPGKETSGDELVGNYTCTIKTGDLPLGISPPPSGCKIYKAGDGSLKMGSNGNGITGDVTSPKASGFFIIGKYQLPGNKFNIKARMSRKGVGNFSGKGRGVLNGNKAKAIKYTLTMKKK